MRGHLERVPVVLGSATPSLESFHHARQGKYRLAELRRRVEDGELPTVHVLDLRTTTRRVPGAPPPPPMLVAPRLIEAIQARLDRHEQSIIFLNRRGYASSLQCPQCGHVEMCPHCSVSPTYHRQAGRLICHLCDFSKAAPPACPACGFAPYTYTGSGTERIEQALKEGFPRATLVRMDSDTMRGKNIFGKTLADFASGRIDILVGTQMIAKGLHFPRVTCVGVINADLALQIPDFRASERVFQLLMQVSGRSGRGELPGEVFVQTRAPFHPAIQFARHHDYAGFVEQELEFRRASALSALRALRARRRARAQRGEDPLHARATDARDGEAARRGDHGAESPAPIARIGERYRFQVFLRTKRITALVARCCVPMMMGRASGLTMCR